jgi:hypothetical protein
MEPIEIVLKLDEMIGMCMRALEEAAKFANKDDVNGEAGRIAQETLIKLYDMHIKLSKEISNKNNNL